MERKQQKLNTIIAGIQVLIFVIMLIFCFLLKGNKEYFFVAGALTAVSLIMMGIFRYILKTESYDLLGSVNTKKYKYDFLMLRKAVLDVEVIFLISGIITSGVIMCLGLLDGTFINLQNISLIPFVCVIIDAIGIVIGVYAIGKRIEPISIL